MNTDNKNELPIQRLRFKHLVSNGRLRTLMGDAEIVRIERVSRHCLVHFRSPQKAIDLEQKIEMGLTDFNTL